MSRFCAALRTFAVGDQRHLTVLRMTTPHTIRAADADASQMSLWVIDAEPTVEIPEPWVSKRAVARHLDCSLRSVETYLAEGCPSILFGNMRRFKLSAVDAWIRSPDNPRHRRAA